VLIGEDPASAVYVRNKVKRAEQSGLRSIEHYLPADATQKELDGLIDDLNNDHLVHGVLVQLPLPTHLSGKSSNRGNIASKRRRWFSP